MTRQRAIVLSRKGEATLSCPFALELQSRGFGVERHFDCDSLLAAVSGNQNEVNLVVLDALSASERRSLVDRLILATPYRSPNVFWITEMQSCTAEVAEEFEHELIGDGTAVRVILRGDMATFRCRLGFVEAWLKRAGLPTLTLRHSRPPALDDEDELLMRKDCHPSERVIDALINGVSLRQAGRHPSDPFRRSDFYTIDQLARARRPLSAEDLAHALAVARGVDDISADVAKNSVKRNRRGMRVLGLDDKKVLRTDEDAYILDKRLIRIIVEHVPD